LAKKEQFDREKKTKMTSKLCKSVIFESTVQRQGDKFISHDFFLFEKTRDH